MLTITLRPPDKQGDHALLIETADGPIAVRMLKSRGHRALLGISAPPSCHVLRESLGDARDRILVAEQSHEPIPCTARPTDDRYGPDWGEHHQDA